MSYNGWKNYPTWAVYTWLSNDPGSEEFATETVKGHRSLGAAADALRDAIIEYSPLQDASMYSDILGWALDSVDWRAVAEAFLSWE